MASPARSASVIRFGAFELDAVASHLRKGGVLLKLHPQPFRVLLLLAERPGQIVDRKEIRRRLWDDNTYVDFEGGINFCIKQVRAVLGDNAEKPKYIETLPRRGYRLIASVSYPDAAGRDLLFAAAHPSSNLVGAAHGNGGARLSFAQINVIRALAPTAAGTGWGSVALRTVAAALAMIAIVTAGAIFYLHRSPKLTEKDTVVLTDFINNTGDDVLGDALRQALDTELEQSPFLNVLSDKSLSEALRMMRRSEKERLTPAVGRELCLRTRSKAVLGGAVSNVGSHYLVRLNAVACGSGDTLAHEQVDARSKEALLGAVNVAASRLRAKLGESLPSVEKYDVPMEEATATSLEALKNYSMGVKILREQGDASSVPFLKRAIEIDPHFAMADAALAIRYTNLNQPSLALAYATKAYELRDTVTEREKFRISRSYFRATGQLEEMSRIFELWIANYPRDASPHGSLCANYYFMGQYEKALAECEQSLRLDPDDAANYENLVTTYFDLNRLPEAKAALDQAQSHGLDSGALRWSMYFLGFLRGDSAQMAHQVAWAVGKPGEEDQLLSSQSDTEAYYGRSGKARELSSRAVDSAVRADSKELAALREVNVALREAEFGNAAMAKRDATEALALEAGRDAKVLAAMTFARIGETTRAKRLFEELKTTYPSNTMLNLYWLPTVNAAIKLREGDAAQAIALLKSVEPYELAEQPSLQLGTLYPAYLRGQALMRTHDGAAATVEFQKLLDHQGIVRNFVTGALAHLQLARAYAIAHDIPKARVAYQGFFAFWKDADPDIPIFVAAKSEYAKLKSTSSPKSGSLMSGNPLD